MLSKLLTGMVMSLLALPNPKIDREPRFFSGYRLKNLFSSQVKREAMPEEFKLDLNYKKGQRIKSYDLYELTN